MKLPSKEEIMQKLPTKEQLKDLGNKVVDGAKVGAKVVANGVVAGTEVVVSGTTTAVKAAKEWVPDVVYDKYDAIKSKFSSPKDIEVKVVEPVKEEETTTRIADDDDDDLPGIV